MITKVPDVLLRDIKDNILTPPNGLRIIYNMPTETTSINEDETIVLKPSVVDYNGMKLFIIYMEIDEGLGLQALDAYII